VISNILTYIGLDVGERRIGVARVNSLAKIAEPLEHITVSEDTDIISEVKKLLAFLDAQAVVIGLPRGLDGQETEQTKFSRKFADNIKSNIKADVYLIDEAGTSKAADEILKNNPSLSRDSVSASILLEDFINYKNKDELKV
jgi:putative Holliday junction resolvase